MRASIEQEEAVVGLLIERLREKGDDRVYLLQPAVAKAVEVGLLPKNVPAEDSVEYWKKIESVLVAFLETSTK
jgi:hypothetical protein